MAFKNVGGGEQSIEIQEENDKYGIIMSLQEIGFSVQGVYKGSEDVPGAPDKKGKPQGTQKMHKFLADGEVQKVRGFGLMNHILKEQISEGDLIKVTYNGKVGDYHKCTVGIDDGSGESNDEDL
jgi:hypothetical protein